MLRRKRRRVMSLILATFLLISEGVGIVQATDPEQLTQPEAGVRSVPEAGTTNAMTTSMLSFFRERLDSIDASKISADEYRVLGVLISNFMIPGQTTVKDIKGEGVNTKLAEVFLGTSEKSSVIGALTQKLYEGITHVSDGLGSATAYTLTKGSTPITGLDFLKEIAIGGKIELNGKVVFDFGEEGTKGKVTRGAMQMLMGISPDIFTSILPKVSGMYMDGVGNIWGSVNPEGGGVSLVDDYILIMPGCINPLTFGGSKLPVNNAFAMGAMVDVTAMAQNSLNKGEVVPYYNIKEKMVGKDVNNMLNIYGIHSPTKYVGNTDGIIKGGGRLTGSELKKALEEYSKASTEGEYAKDNLKVIVSLDLNKSGAEKLEKELSKLLEGVSGEEKSNFVEYFGTNLVYSMNELQQDMYFFSEGGGSQGSFSDNSVLMKNHLMFAEDKGGGNYRFYTNGYGKTGMTSVVEKALKGEDIRKNTGISGVQEEKARKLFLEGSIGEATTGVSYGNYMKSITGKEKLLYSTTQEVSKGSERKYFASIFKLGGTVLGLAHKDTVLIGTVLPFYTQQGKSPFGSNAGSGSIEGSLPVGSQEALMTLYHTTNTYNLFSLDNTIQSKLTGLESGTQSGEVTIRTKIANNSNNWAGIYWAYTSILLGARVTESGVTESGWSNSILPGLTIATTGSLGGGGLGGTGTGTEGGVSSSDDKTISDMQEDIVRKVYGILSENNNDYRNNWIERTIDGIILHWHRLIVGSWVGETFVVGTGKTYTTAVGYLSTPSLEELPLTNWMLKDYALIYMFSLMVLTMILVLMVLTNNRTWQEGLMLFGLMGFVLMIPQSLIVNVVKITNSVTDKMYSEKFNYWAVSQHQEVLGNGLGVGGSSTAEEDMNYTMTMTDEFGSGEARVRIKWMSPKKEEAFNKIYSTDGKLDGIENDLVLTKFLMGNFRHQDEYITTSNESYLYRPYMEIVNSAKSSYEELSGKSVGEAKEEEEKTKENIEEGEDMVEGEVVPRYRFRGMLGEIEEKGEEGILRAVDTYSARTTSEGVGTEYRLWGLGNESITNAIFRETYTIEEAGLTGCTEDAQSRAYLLLTESPYYYFYNVFQSRYTEVNGGFKNALLEEDVFKVTGTGTEADGEIKDFLDLEGLFTNVVPYLKQSNEYVHKWTRIYGKKIEGYDFEKGSGEGERYEEAKLRKEAMKEVWKMYAPWVDGIYESAGGVERKGLTLIGDPLNPGSYEEASAGRERRMCFSRAEMEARNYNPLMLTEAEKRIQKVLEGTYEDMMYLINYYDFEDEVLLAMSAMIATFNFNESFSDIKLIGESTILYPQSFELKNFNFDAFLRLMIVNATGEPMVAKDDLYVRLLEKTSPLTGILLLVVDFIGVILIPTVKILALVLIFMLSVIIGFSCILVPPNRVMQKVLESLGKPTLMLMGLMVGFSFVMSLFMGEGYTSYVGSKTMTLGITDPSILMLAVALSSCAYIYLMCQVVKILWASLKVHGRNTIQGTLGVVGEFTSSVTKNIMSRVGGIVGGKEESSYRGGVSSKEVQGVGQGVGQGGARVGIDKQVKDFESIEGGGKEEELRKLTEKRNADMRDIEEKEEKLESSLSEDIERLARTNGSQGRGVGVETRVNRESREEGLEGKTEREEKREAYEEMKRKEEKEEER